MASAGSLPAICLSPLLNRPACDFSALASASNHSDSSAKPSSRAVLAMPGYIRVYSYVSPRHGCLQIDLRLAHGPAGGRIAHFLEEVEVPEGVPGVGVGGVLEQPGDAREIE